MLFYSNYTSDNYLLEWVNFLIVLYWSKLLENDGLNSEAVWNCASNMRCCYSNMSRWIRIIPSYKIIRIDNKISIGKNKESCKSNKLTKKSEPSCSSLRIYYADIGIKLIMIFSILINSYHFFSPFLKIIIKN